MRTLVRRRRRLPHWLVAIALAVATALVTGQLVAGAAAERDRWGRLVPVVVTTAATAAGDPLRAEVRRLPAGVVPDGALRSVPRRAVAAVGLQPGEIVLEGRLGRLPPGTRGIAVPAGDGLPVEVGDRVDVLATFDAEVEEPTFPVARGAVVVHVGDDAVTVAVPEASVARVAYAVVAGVVTLVLT